MSYISKEFKDTSSVSQSEKLTSNQTKNNAGGYVWEVDDITRLKRFLFLGSEGGSYYSTQKQLTKENIKCVFRLIESGKGLEVVNIVKDLSVQGRIAKQEPLLFVLAACARNKNREVKKAAYSVLNDICRIPTHLFTFIGYCELLSEPGTGWGRAHRNAVSNWYNQKDTKNLAYLVTKYQNRNGWCHKDLLRLSHTKTDNKTKNLIYKYITQRDKVDLNGEEVKEIENEIMDEDELAKFIKSVDFLRAVETVKKNELSEEDILELIKKHNLAREHIPTNRLNSVKIWENLLEKMPITAMVRNLGKMTSIGLLSVSRMDLINKIKDRIEDTENLTKSRIHPLQLLLALKTYSNGKGDKGSLTWNPVRQLVDALDSAFYLSFKTVKPTNKRYVLALDISGSMGSKIMGTSITCCEAATTLAMVTASVEKECHIMGFADTFKPLDVSPKRRLTDNTKETCIWNFGSTDCSLPITWAMKNKVKTDCFIVYTDSETWCGEQHPSEALVKYRRNMKIPNAKLIVVAMTSNGFTIANPDDKYMLDVVGFDTNLPNIISGFVNEEF